MKNNHGELVNKEALSYELKEELKKAEHVFNDNEKKAEEKKEEKKAEAPKPEAPKPETPKPVKVDAEVVPTKPEPKAEVKEIVVVNDMSPTSLCVTA